MYDAVLGGHGPFRGLEAPLRARSNHTSARAQGTTTTITGIAIPFRQVLANFHWRTASSAGS